MAKGWKAVTRIKHGMPDGTVKEFDVGELVDLTDKETMKALWEAGALEAADVPDAPVTAATKSVTATKPDTNDGAAAGTAASQ